MLHRIQEQSVGPNGREMAKAVEVCVHCGFCLATCPTYVTMGEEMDSPRGRIYLMKEALEGNLDEETAGEFIDNCLGCLACVTACPSGVEYGELLAPYRAWAEAGRERGLEERLTRFSLLQTLPFPGRFRLAARAGGWIKSLAPHLPSRFRAMLDLLPDSLPPAESLREIYPAQGKRKARVALLAGCAQQVLAPRINQAAIRVLTRHGVEVAVPRDQGCCGSLAMHIGERSAALQSARRNLGAFSGDYDAIVTTAAGCGSGMKEYGTLFRGEVDEEQAQALSRSTKDVTVFLEEIGFQPSDRCRGSGKRVAYHDACHLAHAQRVRAQPRRLLSSIPGLSLLEPTEWEICCGSAGTYNIEKPDTAGQLGERKARNLARTGADLVAMGNIGCMAQIERHLRAIGEDVPVVHTVELLDET